MKKITALILALTLIFALAGCAQKTETKDAAKDTTYSGKADAGIAADTPEVVKNAIIALRSDTPASKKGADGTLYGGDREFEWEIADYLASGGYKHLGEWKNDVFVDVDDTAVVYRERGEKEVFALANYAEKFLNYYSVTGDKLHASTISAERCEIYDSDVSDVTATVVTDAAYGFNCIRETGAAFTWTIDENGYRYSTGKSDYLISDTNVIDELGTMKQLFYIRTSGGGYEIRAACENMSGIVKLAEHEEHVDATDDNGEFDSTYVAVVGKGGELAWPDGKDPTTYRTCSYVASTAGRGWINSADEKIEDLTMICLGQADIPTGMSDFIGLLDSVGIKLEKLNIIGKYAPEVAVMGYALTDSASVDAVDNAVREGVKTEVTLG